MTWNIKNKAITKMYQRRTTTKTETNCPERNPYSENFACLAGKPTQPKSDGLQNDLPKDSPNSQQPLRKDSCRQTQHDLKNEKPKTENAGTRQPPAGQF